MNKAFIGASAAVVIGAGAAAGYYVYSHRTPKALDCDQAKTALDARLATLPADTKAHYTGFTCDAASGKLGFTDFTLASVADGKETPAARFDTVAVDGAKGANIAKVFDPASYTANQGTASPDKQPLFAALTAAKATLGQGDNTVTLTNLRITDLAARPFAKAPPVELSAVKNLGRAEALDIAQAFSYKEIAFDNVTGQDGFSIGGIKIGPYDGAILSNFEISKLSAKDPNGKGTFSIDSFAFGGLDLGSLYKLPANSFDTQKDTIKALLSVTADSLTLKNLSADGMEKPDDSLKVASFSLTKLKNLGFEKLSLEGLSGKASAEQIDFAIGKFSLSGFDAGPAMQAMADGASFPDPSKFKINGYELADLSFGKAGLPKITLAGLTGKVPGYVDDVPTGGSSTLSKLVIPAPIIEQAEDREPLTQLGYDQLVFNMTSDYSYDPKGKELDVKDFTIELENGGKLSLPFKLTNFDYKALQGASLQILENGMPPLGLLEAKVASLKLIYSDNSLFDRVLKVVAAEENSNPAEMKTMAKQMLSMQSQQAPGPVTKAAIDAVVAFIDKPKTLTISVSPDKPIGYMDAATLGDDPEAISKALNLTVKSE